MADTKTTALTAATSWASGDLLYLVRDPAGTPVSRKITIDNILQNLVCAANTSLIKSTSGYSLTGSNASSMIDLAGTWNTSGTPTLIKANVTDTASNAASLLMDLQVGGVSKLSLTKSSTLSGDASTGLTVNFGTLNHRSGNNCGYTYSGGHRLSLGLNGYIAWGTTNDTFAATGLWLGTDAANTLALRNSTNAQAFNIYNTYTSGSVYERGFMRWVGNVLEIGTEHVGASARGISFKTGGTERIGIGAAGIVAVTGGVTATSYVWPSYLRLAASDFAHIYAPANGVVTLYNTTEADFNRLQFGGITSSFPSIKRSTTILQARLADDSDFGTYQGKLRVHANATSETVTPTHTLRLFDAAGTEYRVPAIAV